MGADPMAGAAPADPAMGADPMAGAAPAADQAAAGAADPMAGAAPADPATSGAEPATEASASDEEPSDDSEGDEDDDMLSDDEFDEEADEIKKSQEHVSQKIDTLADKFEHLLGKLDTFEKKIEDSDQRIADLKADMEKRNPTPEQKMSIRSTQSVPYKDTPSEYWEKKEETSNYSPEDDHNGEDMPEYQIKQSDVDNIRDWANISKSFDDERLNLKDILGY
jgi:chaperonin cofactor prefoldin